MRVGLYLRKSTDEQADSIATQDTNGRAWCKAKGWPVVAVFADSGISRDEFSPERRRDWFAMLEAAGRHELDAIVVRETSRVGANIGRSLVFVEDLLATGVKLFQYIDGAEVTNSNAIECVTLALKFFASQGEVEGIRSRTREALFTKAKAGRVAGGSTYGYRNQPSAELVRDRRGNTKAAYVERVVDPVQAKWVVFIFEKYNAGHGNGAIAKMLNLRGVPAPRAGNGGSPGWREGAVREILRHDIYRGVLIYGVWKKVYVGGRKKRVRTPESEWVVVEAPELAIVKPELWASTRARMGTRPRPREKSAKTGRPASNLLSGILRCGVCGSTMKVESTKVSAKTEPAYMCTAFEGKRPVPHVPGGFCTNTWRRPIAEVNANIISWLESEILRDDIMHDALEEARRRIQERVKKRHDDTPELRTRAARIRAERDKLLGLALGAPDKSTEAYYHSEIANRTAELEELEGRIRAVDVAPNQVDVEIRRMMAEATRRVSALREVLSTGSAVAGRALLEQFFPEGIVADPVVIENTTGKGRRTAKRFALTAESCGDWPLVLLAAGGVSPSKVASPASRGAFDGESIGAKIAVLFRELGGRRRIERRVA